MIGTIEDDEEIQVAIEDSDEEETSNKKKVKNVFDQNFKFEIDSYGDSVFKWELDEAIDMIARKVMWQSIS